MTVQSAVELLLLAKDATDFLMASDAFLDVAEGTAAAACRSLPSLLMAVEAGRRGLRGVDLEPISLRLLVTGWWHWSSYVASRGILNPPTKPHLPPGDWSPWTSGEHRGVVPLVQCLLDPMLGDPFARAVGTPLGLTQWRPEGIHGVELYRPLAAEGFPE